MSLNYTEVHKYKNSCMMSILQPKQQYDFLINLTENEKLFFENLCDDKNTIDKRDKIDNKCLVLHLFQDCMKLKYNKNNNK